MEPSDDVSPRGPVGTTSWESLRRTDLDCSWISGSQNLYEIRDVSCWRLLSLGVICYVATDDTGFPGASEVKASASNAGDPGLIPGSGRSSGEGNGNPLQYSCLENPMDWGAWWAVVHGVTKSRTWLSDFTYLLTYLLCSNRWHTIGMNHHGMRFLCLNSLF